MNSLEKFFEEVFNEGIRLQEIFIKKDFIDVIDKVIRDCFIVFLNTLAKNNPDTYKFIKPVSNISALR